MNGTPRKLRQGIQAAAAGEVRAVLDSIRRIVRLLRVSSREAEREVGLTGAQLFVLQKLAEAGVLSVNELAERTHTHQSSVSVVAQSLVDKDLVARSKSAADGRRLELTLTPAAKALLRKAPGAAQDRLIEALDRLPAATRAQLAKSLGKLVDEAGLGDEAALMIFEDEVAPKTSKPKARSRTSRRTARNVRR
jgi:DNA-binding MarR family transcriptional regulator